MKLDQDGTFKDYCKHYGGDCGDCFKFKTGYPECFEGFVGEGESPSVYCHECSEAGGAMRVIYHLPPACKTQIKET